MIKNSKILFLFLFNFIIGQVILLMSLYYLNLNRIYIIEEGVYTHWNNSFEYFVAFFIINFLILYIFIISLKKKVIIKNSVKMSAKTFYFLLFLSTFILFLLFLNLKISGTPPLMQAGYISRFDYLQETKLWFVLKIFGSPAAIVPILIGVILLKNKQYNFIKSNNYIYFITFFYFFYLILIGQKFGGLQLGIFFIVLPTFADRILKGKKILTLKVIFLSSFIFVSIFLLIIYHYSNLSVANDFGGPLKFIAYRIFALQGHTFWGTIENINNFNSSFFLWWDGMHNIMRVIGIHGIENAIDRGVNFTAGYPVILIAIFPIIIAYCIHAIIMILFFYYVRFWIYNLYNLKYIIYSYLFIYISSFLGHGSLKYLFSYKVFILFCILFFVNMLRSIYVKQSHKK